MAKEKKINSVSDQIAALSKISQAISSDLYLEDILRLIVAVTAQVMNSKICSIMLLDEKKQYLVIRATQSICEAYNKKAPLKISEGIAGKVVSTNRPKSVYNILKEKEYKYKDIARKEGLSSLLCVPLNVKNKAIGVINLYTTTPHRFTNNEIYVLTAVANQAAMVIENTELMVKTNVIREELEARKIIERAKGILMRDRRISEEESYRLIQKYSMNRRKSMRQIAEAVILTKEMQ